MTSFGSEHTAIKLGVLSIIVLNTLRTASYSTPPFISTLPLNRERSCSAESLVNGIWSGSLHPVSQFTTDGIRTRPATLLNPPRSFSPASDDRLLHRFQAASS